MSEVRGTPVFVETPCVFTAVCHRKTPPRATLQGTQISFSCATCGSPVGFATVSHVEGAYLVAETPKVA